MLWSVLHWDYTLQHPSTQFWGMLVLGCMGVVPKVTEHQVRGDKPLGRIGKKMFAKETSCFMFVPLFHSLLQKIWGKGDHLSVRVP